MPKHLASRARPPADRTGAPAGRHAFRPGGHRRVDAAQARRGARGTRRRGHAFTRAAAQGEWCGHGGDHHFAPHQGCPGGGLCRGLPDEGRIRQHRASPARRRRREGRRGRENFVPGRGDAGCGLQGAAGDPRDPAHHRPQPGRKIPGPAEIQPRPHRSGPAGQARPGHRPGRRGSAGRAGALAPHQEQPGPDRRARGGQDRHRGGSGPADRGQAMCPRP